MAVGTFGEEGYFFTMPTLPFWKTSLETPGFPLHGFLSCICLAQMDLNLVLPVVLNWGLFPTAKTLTMSGDISDCYDLSGEGWRRRWEVGVGR